MWHADDAWMGKARGVEGVGVDCTFDRTVADGFPVGVDLV